MKNCGCGEVKYELRDRKVLVDFVQALAMPAKHSSRVADLVSNLQVDSFGDSPSITTDLKLARLQGVFQIQNPPRSRYG